MEPHAQALPQNRVHHPQKNKHDYPKNPKTGIEITRQAVDLPGFVQRRLKMGIKIELTDDEIVEPSGQRISGERGCAV